MRMGKGKGSFDHWAARVAVNQIVLELRGMIHEQVVRDAFRLAGNKLPGKLYTSPTLYSNYSNVIARAMGVREERRATCGWNYEAGWNHTRRFEKTTT